MHPLPPDTQRLSQTEEADPHAISVEFGRSPLRLRCRDWGVVAAILVVFAYVGPHICERYEQPPKSLDGRIPYELTEDYWAYRRQLKTFVEGDRIPLIGDSVVWGEYVSASESLSANLNSSLPSPRFANAGLNGIHPLALGGLIDLCLPVLKIHRVIVHCNLLWMSSPERDLQISDDVAINHTKLLPQFLPNVPSYSASLSPRLGIVVERYIPLFEYMSHVRTQYFEGRDLQSWSITHPYSNPFEQLQRVKLADTDEQRHKPIPWNKAGIPSQDIPWVELPTSLQWQAWCRSIEKMRSHGCRVLVLAGPFNEHLLSPSSRGRYETMKRHAQTWHDQQRIPCITLKLLPSDAYGDASHPLRSGYERIAEELSSNAVFRHWLEN